MKKTLFICTLMALVVGMFIPLTASAATYVVNPAGTGDFPTIQAAINAATTGDIIELTDGIYTGGGNRDVNYSGKLVTVRSQSGDSTACIIDCQGSSGDPHIGFYFYSGEGPTAKLKNITIINGFSDMLYAPLAIYISGASPTIDGCVFVDNGVNITGYANPTFVGCVFRDFNTGGFSQSPISISNTGGRVADVAVEDCVFHNSTFGGEYGYGQAIRVSGTAR